MSRKNIYPKGCSVKHCDTTSLHLIKEMCQKHYTRMHRNGTIKTERHMHGLTNTPEYRVWSAMVQRCTNHKNKWYSYYGGRGIKVYKPWLIFDNFISDMGKRPLHGTIDRIDNNGNYEPGNCSWVTQKAQSNNTRRNHVLSHMGRRMTIAQWANDLGLKYSTLYGRINKNWPLDKALRKEYYHGTKVV